MHNSTIVLLINDEARVVKGVYEEGGKSALFKTFDHTIKEDDLVVVQSSTRHEMTVVKVTEVDVEINFDTTGEIKWVVQKIEQDDFARLLEQEEEAIAAVQEAERNRKKKELKASLFENHEDKLASLSLSNSEDLQVLEKSEETKG